MDKLTMDKTKYFGFETALKYLKEGKRVFRLYWNGKGMYLEAQYPDKNSKMNMPYIYLTMPGYKVTSPDGEESSSPARLIPWVASQTDLLANDWDVAIEQ